MKISRLVFLPSLLAALIFANEASAQTIQSLTNQLASTAGEQVAISDLGRNKLTIVSFWATWCKPCKDEMKAMQPLYDKLKDKGVQYIAGDNGETEFYDVMRVIMPSLSGQSMMLNPNESKDFTFTVPINTKQSETGPERRVRRRLPVHVDRRRPSRVKDDDRGQMDR